MGVNFVRTIRKWRVKIFDAFSSVLPISQVYLKMSSQLIISLSFLVIFSSVAANNVKGIVNLDSLTFEKVISKFETVLVKFDSHYPYGDKQNQYIEVAESASSIPDLLIASVGIREYGEKENLDLAKRFNVIKEDYPKLKLFRKGDTENPIDYEGENFTAADIKIFIKKSADVHVGLASCIKELDDIAKSFMDAAGESDRKKLLEKAKLHSSSLKDAKQKKSSETYIKLMQKVLDKGDRFVELERDRVKNIQAGKLTVEKKQEMQSKLNILHSFIKEEL